MKKIINSFWGWIASNVCDTLKINEIIEILTEYNKIENLPVLTDVNGYVVPCQENVYAIKDKTGSVIDIYYKNLHFHLVDTPAKKVFQIFVKPDIEDWNIIKNGNVFDISNPITKCVEVFYWFDIETMHGFRCMNDSYIKGFWNEYVAKTVEEFEKTVRSYTVEEFVSNAYKNYKKNSVNDESKDCE